VSTTPRQPLTPATVAAWRRRREASVEVPPHPEDTEEPWNGFRVPAYAAISPAPDITSNGFAESQQAGLTAMISIAKSDAPPRPLPVIKPYAPSPDPSASPLGQATNAAPSRSAPVSTSLAPAMDQSAVFPPPAWMTPAHLTIKEETRRNSGPTAGGKSDNFTNLPALPLIVILTVQVVLSLRLVWSNTAFTDEALYLWAGRLEWSHWLHNTPIPPFPIYFSGAPVLYPPIGALANSVGGLAGARILSLCFMLGATLFLYDVTRRIFDRYTAIFASALFSGLGSAQYLSAFATYDAMALCLLATATWLGVRAAACRSAARRVALILLSTGVMVTADATKYAACLFDPVILTVIVCFHWRELGRRAAVTTASLMLSATAIGITIALALGGAPYSAGIASTTLSRAQGNWPIFGILFVSAGWVGAVAGLAVIGAIAASCAWRTGPERVLVWTLAAAAFLAPAEQARIHVFTSLFKHVAFGGWFAAAMAGYALTAFIRTVPATKVRGALQATLSLIMVTWIVGLMLATNQFGSWANANPVLPALTATLRANPGPLLVDVTAPFDYYLMGKQSWRRIASIPRSSAQAEAQIVQQRRFSVILLSYAIGGGDCGNVDPKVRSTQGICPHHVDIRMLSNILTYGGYRLVARIPYRTAAFKSVYMIWAREGSR
jgi:hypothetical protein